MTRVLGYAAAKAGITNFTQYLATEVASKFGEGIRVNTIAPGFSSQSRIGTCSLILMGLLRKEEMT